MITEFQDDLTTSMPSLAMLEVFAPRLNWMQAWSGPAVLTTVVRDVLAEKACQGRLASALSHADEVDVIVRTSVGLPETVTLRSKICPTVTNGSPPRIWKDEMTGAGA